MPEPAKLFGSIKFRKVDIMNETLQTIKTRYSCRSYNGKLPGKDKLDAIAMAAVQSPSAVNQQLWEIVVVTDKALIEEMDANGMEYLANAEDKTTYQRFMERGGTLFYNTPAMFIILTKPGTEVDCGIVSENIALAASSLGLGNVICGMAKIPFIGSKADYFRERVGFHDDWDFGMAVLVGETDIKDGAPHTPDVSKIRFV